MSPARALHAVSNWWGLAGAVLVAALLSLVSFAPKVTGTDDSVYLVTAKALAMGRGFAKINLIGSPPETLYPPGLPLLLAPIVARFPQWPDYVKPAGLLCVLFMLLAIVASWLLLRAEGATVAETLGPSLVMATSYVGIGWYSASVIMSEPAFTLFSVAGLLLLTAYLRQRNRAFLVASGLVLGMAYLTRTVGITALAAGLVYLVWRRDYKSALAFGCIAAGFVLTWTFYTAAVQASAVGQACRNTCMGGYFDSAILKNWQRLEPGKAGFSDLVMRLFGNINGHATHTILSLFFPTLTGDDLLSRLQSLNFGAIPGAVGYGTLVLIGIGWLSRIRGAVRPLELYICFYVCMILIPSWYTVRNLVPILPFLAFYAMKGINAVWLVLSAKVIRTSRLTGFASSGLILLVVASNLVSDRHQVVVGLGFLQSGASYAEPTPSFAEVCDWIKQNTEPGALVSSKSSDKMYLCSGRQTPARLSTMPFLFGFRGADVVFQDIVDYAEWVVIDTTEQPTALTNGEPEDAEALPELKPMIEKDTSHFLLAYQTASAPSLRIYKVIR